MRQENHILFILYEFVFVKPKIIDHKTFFFFGHTHSMWKFLGQGWKLRHISDPGCCNDNTISLAHHALPRELPKCLLRHFYTLKKNLFLKRTIENKI